MVPYQPYTYVSSLFTIMWFPGAYEFFDERSQNITPDSVDMRSFLCASFITDAPFIVVKMINEFKILNFPSSYFLAFLFTKFISFVHILMALYFRGTSHIVRD